MKSTVRHLLLVSLVVGLSTAPAWSTTIRGSSNYGSPPVFSGCSGGGTFSGVTVTCLAATTTGAFPGQPIFTFSVPSGSPVPIAADFTFPGRALPGAFGLVQCDGTDTPATSPCTSASSPTNLGALMGTASNAHFTFSSFSSPVSVFFDVNAMVTGVTVASSAVPEPATGGLMALPLAVGLLLIMRRRAAAGQPF